MPPERVDVVPNGIHTEPFESGDLFASRWKRRVFQLDSTIALYVGRVERERGVLHLYLRVRVAGDEAPERAELGVVVKVCVGRRPPARQKRLKAPVTFVGARPHDVALGLARRARELFVLPSWNEGTPNACSASFGFGGGEVAANARRRNPAKSSERASSGCSCLPVPLALWPASRQKLHPSPRPSESRRRCRCRRLGNE